MTYMLMILCEDIVCFSFFDLELPIIPLASSNFFLVHIRIPSFQPRFDFKMTYRVFTITRESLTCKSHTMSSRKTDKQLPIKHHVEKTKDWATQQKRKWTHMLPEGSAVSASLVTPVLLVLNDTNIIWYENFFLALVGFVFFMLSNYMSSRV
jgi:hypothetical protein